MAEKLVTYKVMYDKGEDINGKNVRPYDTFKAVPNDDLDTKVKKGFLEIVTPAKSKNRSVSKKRK